MDFGYGVEEDSVQACRSRHFRSDFTRFHERLVDIVCGRHVPDESALKPEILSNGSIMTRAGLKQLALMIELEFLESLQREVNGTEDAAASNKSEPHPYDVWLTETTIDNRNRRLAICMPNRSNDLCWYDGFHDVWNIDPPCHKWRVASLSGPARTLAALADAAYNDTLMEHAMNRDLIVDVLEDDDYADDLLRGRLSEDLLSRLNSSQRQAVATLFDPAFARGFLAIQGPPGTGKSSALVAMIVAYKEEGGLLVLAPSNAAVANIAMKAWMTGHFSLENLLVFGDNADESVHFLNPIFRGEHFSKVCKDFSELSKFSKDNIRRGLCDWLHMESDATISYLSQFCPYIDRSIREGREFYGRLISKAKIVFSTLNSSGSALPRNFADVRTILLDEAGQCSEADFYIAASFPGVQRMVTVGDPNQLPATVVHLACRRAGLGTSWLENVLSNFRHKVHVLDTQYRM